MKRRDACRATKALTSALLIAVCATVWEDRFPLPSLAPGQDLAQEYRLTVCRNGDEISMVNLERRTLDGDAALSTWSSVTTEWPTAPPSSGP